MKIFTETITNLYIIGFPSDFSMSFFTVLLLDTLRLKLFPWSFGSIILEIIYLIVVGLREI